MAVDYKIKWYGKIIFNKATEANVRAMKKAALLVEGYAKESVSKQGTGRFYARSKKGKKIRIAITTGETDRRFKKRGQTGHRASVPGKPPALDFGNLMNSIQSRVTVGAAVVKGEVGSDIDYALYLEVGTHNMKARPYLRPAVTANKRKINKIFRDSNR